MEIFDRNPPYEGARPITSSRGIVFCSALGSPFASDDPAEWIDTLEEHYREQGLRTNFHFYISKKGDIYEGLGWGARTHHLDNAIAEEGYNNGNCHVVLFLGSGEEFNKRAANAGRYLVEEHIERFGPGPMNKLARDVIQNSHSGGHEVGNEFTLASWVHHGCPPVFRDSIVGPTDEDVFDTEVDVTELKASEVKQQIVDIEDLETLTTMLEDEEAQSKPRSSVVKTINDRMAVIVGDADFPTEDS